MDLELLKKVIEENSGALVDVSSAAYKLKPTDEAELIGIAKKTNEKLGFELFEDLDGKSLAYDFSTVARKLFIYTLEKAEFKNDRLEKAVLEHSDDILQEVVEAYAKMEKLSPYELALIANGVNKKLGYRLFRDLYSLSIKRDFERVVKAVDVYQKEGKILKFLK